MSSKKIATIAISCWSGLGFYRGLQEYNYEHKKGYRKGNYMYLNCFVNGCKGLFMYTVPVFWIPIAYKELARGEICIRGLEITHDYYRLL
jgi:hypothetical protein